MAGNIYGYQGVHTPLESVTQGRYTLADYTSMRTELTSRLIALENQGGFVPTNVEITGYLHMLPGGAGNGEIETPSSITGESLYINSNAQCGSLQCNGNLTAGTSIFGGNVTVNGGSIISGNGSGLTNINDITKLPLSGGNISGNLAINGTVGIGGTMTFLGNAPSGYDNGIVHAGDSLLVASNGTQTQSLTLTTWSNTTTGLRISPASVLLGSGGSASYYPSASIECSGTTVHLQGNTTTAGNITVSAPGKFIGDGSLITGVVSTDSTKLPLTGGTLTGNLTVSAPSKYFGDGSALTGVISTDVTKLPLTGGTLTGTLYTNALVNIQCGGSFLGNASKTTLCELFSIDNTLASYSPAADQKFYHIGLNYSNPVTINMQYLYVNPALYPDNIRYVTVTKKSMATSDYTVTLIAPPNYVFHTSTANGTTSITMGIGVFSYFLLISGDNISGQIWLLSKT